MDKFKSIYCCECEEDVNARLTNGSEIYPHRKDLASLPFWRCDTCNGKVGCHHKTKNKTAPLGVIPTPEISRARSIIHSNLDVIWKTGEASRKSVYKSMSEKLGYEFHSAKIKTPKEAEKCILLSLIISEEYGF